MNDIQLWEKYNKTKDSLLRENLILKYLYLVKIVAGKLYSHYNSKVEYDDLVSYGIFGLIDAIDKYDMSKNVKFESYAQIRIKGSIIDHLRDLDWVPRSVRKQAKDIQDIYNTLEARYGRPVTDEEVSTEMGISIDLLQKSLSDINAATILSLDEMITIFREEKQENLEDKNHTPYSIIESKDIKNIITKALKELPEKEQLIVTLYYYEELTYKEISKIMGISESRISQLHTKAVLRLKGKLAKHKLIS